MPGLLWAWKFSKASALVSVVRLLPVAREISALRGVSPRCTHHWVRRVDSTIFQWVSGSFWVRFVSSRPSQPSRIRSDELDVLVQRQFADARSRGGEDGVGK